MVNIPLVIMQVFVLPVAHFPVDGIRKGLPTSARHPADIRGFPLPREKKTSVIPIRSLPVCFHHRWGITSLPTIESHESLAA